MLRASEDAAYFWTLSRYIHLNPCRSKPPMAESHELWPYSSFPGYVRKSRQVDWVDYDGVHTAWLAENGGSDPARAYRQYVRKGLESPEDPFKESLRKWVFGSEEFLRRMIALAEGSNRTRHEATSRRLKSVTVEDVLVATAKKHGVDHSAYKKFRSQAPGRDMAAWLCRRWTGATLSDLGEYFGLNGTDSVSNLVRRAEKQRGKSRQWRMVAANM